jgi:hypothetical protein
MEEVTSDAPIDLAALELETAEALILLDLLSFRLGPDGRAWIERTNALIHPNTRAPEQFLQLFQSTARQLGRAPIELKPHERERLSTGRVDWPIDGWALDELGRAVLLLIGAAYLLPDELDGFVHEAFRAGDLRERQAILRTLVLLPAAARFLPIVEEALASHARPLFEAIACDNSYPARHFSDDAFLAMVQHAVKAGIPPARIRGLDGRRTPAVDALLASLVR